MDDKNLTFYINHASIAYSFELFNNTTNEENKMSLEKLPDWVPEVGTIVEVTPKCPSTFYKKAITSYRSKVILVTKREDDSYTVTLDGNLNILIRPRNWTFDMEVLLGNPNATVNLMF
ncbi:MAG: hypothetical protein NTZ13_04650 [Candidatus Parcubacteria bacterium]|nr:hypothetical protein [Candidatus Parcubacteria bacterium]